MRTIEWLAAPTLASSATFALVSGLMWWPLVQLGVALGGEMTPLPTIGDSESSVAAVVGWCLIWSTGALYSALVLLPRLASDRRTPGRVALLLVAGAFCYWAAVNFAIGEIVASADSAFARVTIAGTLAALFIGAVATLVAGGRARVMLWLWLALAGALGGAKLGYAIDYLDDDFEGLAWVPGHIAWQVFTCIALWFGAWRFGVPTTNLPVVEQRNA